MGLARTLLLPALVACSGSAQSGTTPPVVSVDRSSAARDALSSIPPSTVTAAATANNAFAVSLYSHVLSTAAPGNVLTSPLSASLALTMAYAGAAGQTATEMAAALQLGSAAGSIFDGQNALSQALASRAATALAADQQSVQGTSVPAPAPSDYQVQIVNSAWGQTGYSWQPPFLTILAQSYGTGVYVQNFSDNPDAALQTINTWVSGQTADKITNLFLPGMITAATRLVLVDAIHVKLPWMKPFTASATTPGTFTRGDGTTVSVSFMNQTNTWSYVDDGQAQIVALPLSGGQLSVVIALPHGDLATYEAGLTTGSAALATPPSSAPVNLSLPKVTFTSPSFSLVSVLKAMGMVQAFEPGIANFSGMCGDSLYISEVVQKATIAMQETGVEAAAATGVVFQGLSASAPGPTPTPMLVNRPYLIAVVDDPTGAIVFLGHVEDPTASGNP
jgi:serpin B